MTSLCSSDFSCLAQVFVQTYLIPQLIVWGHLWAWDHRFGNHTLWTFKNPVLKVCVYKEILILLRAIFLALLLVWGHSTWNMFMFCEPLGQAEKGPKVKWRVACSYEFWREMGSFFLLSLAKTKRKAGMCRFFVSVYTG